MSVPKGERNEAESQYVYTARELEAHTIRKCIGFPKRYTFYLSQPIAQMAGRVYEHAVCANSIYPTCHEDYLLRRQHLLEANSELRALIAQMELAAELFGLAHDGTGGYDMDEPESKKMQYWSELAYREVGLLKGVIKRDAQRFGKLK